MYRPNLALVWAFLSTSSAASSTVLYLVFMHGQDWAPGFIQLYSTMGMVSGWLNALIYFLVPHSAFLQRRLAGICFFGFAILLAASIYHLVFHQPLTPGKLAFLATCFIPILYANAFGVEFYEGNYPWPYRRVVTFNFCCLIAAALALAFNRTEEALYNWTAMVGVAFFLRWTLDHWNRIDEPTPLPPSLRPWANPSLPILERTLWDQWAIARLDVLNWSFWIYALSRVLTFSGNVIYSYLMGTGSAAFAATNKNRSLLLWSVAAVALPVAFLGYEYQWCAFLLGQLFAWMVTSQLTLRYRERSNAYGLFLLIWISDFTLRFLGLMYSHELQDYTRILLISASLGIFATFVLALRKPAAPFPGTANTKSRPGDFPSIR